MKTGEAYPKPITDIFKTYAPNNAHEKNLPPGVVRNYTELNENK